MTYETAFTLSIVAGGTAAAIWAFILAEFTPGVNLRNVSEVVLTGTAGFLTCLFILGFIFA